METETALLLALALNGFIASGIIMLFKNYRKIVEGLTVISSLLSLGLSLYLIFSLMPPFQVTVIPHVSLLADKLSLFFSIVVSIVGTAVAFYSIDYMREAEDYTRYYSLITLFIGAMLNLVLSADLIYLLFNWELVGVCSALLIGYWWERESARKAGIKALVMTRIGDVGLIAFTAIAIYYGSTNIPAIFSKQNLFSVLLPFAPFLVLAAMGKSAQFPLHTWLPDAMEGPTTVSALLHAATMVKAGVYLMLRFYPMLIASNISVLLLLATSLITLYIASFAGLASMDIKRILAFSTLSSLSLMFLAISMGEFYIAILYLFNHALFKALLFLSTGKVEHTLHTRDISKLKGLWRKGFRLETLCFLIGALNAAGLPPLASGFIKEEIFLGLLSKFSLIAYSSISFTLSFLLSLFIMRPFVLSFISNTSDRGTELSSERTPFMFGVNSTLLLLTLSAYLPTSLLASYLTGSNITENIEISPFSGVLLGIICSFLIPKIRISLSTGIRTFFESSMGFDALYNKVGEIFARKLSMGASKFNKERASQGLNGMIIVIALLILILVVSML